MPQVLARGILGKQRPTLPWAHFVRGTISDALKSPRRNRVFPPNTQRSPRTQRSGKGTVAAQVRHHTTSPTMSAATKRESRQNSHHTTGCTEMDVIQYSQTTNLASWRELHHSEARLLTAMDSQWEDPPFRAKNTLTKKSRFYKVIAPSSGTFVSVCCNLNREGQTRT